MGYLVTAPLVIAKDQAGRLQHAYQGSWIPWLSSKQKEHFLRHNLIEEIADQEAADAGVVPLDSLVEKPKKTAPKDEWVKFGVSKGNSEAELNALTKDELVELLGDF